ncbi:FG-GAP-like repeat-containing protein [Hydrotalea sp.]|uniref:FG-GAP-like repeat-containing protein n=1 Tax=Hydrotalea sp. TaxID=2881279 RepID=UPI00261097C4|nr:FG-GAP-like repeat-containing protein [Hydrotalea sp.]
MKYLLLCLSVMVFVSCHQKNTQTLFTLMPNTGIHFRNDVTDGRLENSFLFRNFYNGGGVAIGDVNNDGLPDVFFTSNMGENKLYLNEGNFKFKDITATAGFQQDSMWSTGVVFVDMNNDGWLDIYVCNSGHMSNGNRRNKLYINNHNSTFTEAAHQYGLDHKGYTTQVSFFDYDLDGDLDCFIIDNSPIPVNQLAFNNNRDLPDSAWKVAEFLKGGGNHLLRNDNGHFVDVTQQAGLHSSLISFGLGISVGDVNGDGYPDIYVSNDSYERDYLYINQRNGTFKDEFEDRIRHTSFSSMGSDFADINNDGCIDIFNTDMLPDDDYRLKTTGAFDNIDLFRSKLRAGFYYQYVKNCLQLNDKNGKFSEIANYAGVPASDWSWGALMFDMDNDGYNDIYVCNGVNRDVTDLDFIDFFANDVIQKMVLTGKKDNVDQVLLKIPQNPLPNKAFHNQHDLRFIDKAKQWGLVQSSFSNGAAYGDLDNDGDLDLVVNNENMEAFVYKNNSREINKNHYVGFLLKGTSQNNFAIGSKIEVYANGQIMSRDVFPSRGFQSSMDYKQIIGLGQLTHIDSIHIIWPNLGITTYPNPSIDTVYHYQQPTIFTTFFKKENTTVTPLLDSVKSVFEKHVEDDNIDFNYERNIPKMLSREGPKAAVADVNGDGLADVYIGGTVGYPGQIYWQQANGSFVQKPEPAFAQFSDFEDGALAFLDYDHDGDMDLLVCPTGNTHPSNTRQMQLRLFTNDGKGNFSIKTDAFPNTGMNVSAIAVHDFNGDGYPDIFVGGRNEPRNYGADPQSFLFVNDGKGHFTDIAATKNPAIAHIGMVTGAQWADVLGTGKQQLIIVGEWMTPHIFSVEGDKFTEVNTNLNNKYGWWESLAVADVNGDGLNDLIIGNIGENFYLHPDSTHPVKLWINDFNQNGVQDKVLTSTINGKDLPVFLKREMENEIPSLKKNNLKHHDYAAKSVQELFPASVINSCLVKQFNYAPSVIAINKGNGVFELQKLPPVVQFSSVNAIRCTDLNGDGKIDVLLGGNEFGFLPQFERLDASYGTVLMNRGNAVFKILSAQQSGVELESMVRDIVEIPTKNKPCFLFLQNDAYPVLFQLHNEVNILKTRK